MGTPATDLEIRKWVSERFGFEPKPGWIAHCRRLCDLQVPDVPAYQESRLDPCPLERQAAIMKAFRHFGLIPKP
jgi:hypothetical protein